MVDNDRFMQFGLRGCNMEALVDAIARDIVVPSEYYKLGEYFRSVLKACESRALSKFESFVVNMGVSRLTSAVRGIADILAFLITFFDERYQKR